MIRTGSRGFSLLEMTIVLIIMSLLVLLALPTLTGTLGHMEVRGAAKRISAILRYCRSDAINKKRINLVSFDADTNLVSAFSMEEGEEAPKAQKHYPLPEGVKMEEIDVGKTLFDSSSPTIEFYANGGSSGGSAVIRGRKGRAYTIRVEMLTGGVKIEATDQK